MSTLFWIFALLGCAVLVGVWLATHEGEHNRQRRLKRIQRRLEQIEAAKLSEEKRDGA